MERSIAEIVQAELAEEISATYDNAIVELYVPFHKTNGGTRSGPDRKILITSRTDPLLLIQIRLGDESLRVFSQLGTISEADHRHLYSDPASITQVFQVLDVAFGGG